MKCNKGQRSAERLSVGERNDDLMAIYDNRQMNRMRQDAIRRSQEMHRRSMVNTSHYSQGHSEATDLPPTPAAEEGKNAAAEVKKPAPTAENKSKNPLSGIFDMLREGEIDSDKLMIIALMVILAREGADMKLILALGYILL